MWFAPFYPRPERIIRRDRATIVIFDDGTKRVVRLQDGDTDDMYVAICIAIAKKFCGSGTNIKRLVDKVEYLGDSKANKPEIPKPKRQKQHQYAGRAADYTEKAKRQRQPFPFFLFVLHVGHKNRQPDRKSGGGEYVKERIDHIGGIEIAHAVLADDPVKRDLEQHAANLRTRRGQGEQQYAVKVTLSFFHADLRSK